ncbi:variable surface lipoprotein [Mycoplasmopsis agalactiae]|uniref:variable surface lipoprotein n=1 Tax=Mycoplasmopsis agalactiae TaxID=2110 RepID=UPI001F177E24|nr:variable surface lipoprotein [Mycoplasmopsis agalactiae]MCE6115133.1 variable surface lipoprotein [Mycoplasmopsis agalactiae]
MKRNRLLLSFGSLSVFSAIPFIAAKCDDTSEKDNKNPINPGNPGDSTENQVAKVKLGKLSEKVKQELNKLAKDGVTKAQVVTALKTEKGLENLTESDLAKVEFKDNKLTIEANKESKLVSGTYEYSTQKQTPDAVIDLSKVQVNGETKKLLKAEAKEKPDKAKVLAALKNDKNFAKLTESDFEVSFKDSTLTVKATAGSKVIKGELSISSKTELDNITLTKEIKEKLQTELSKDSFKQEDIVKVLKGHQELKGLEAKDVDVKKEGNKLTVTARSDSAKFTGTLSFVFKAMLDKVMNIDIKNQLGKEIKNNPNSSNIVNILKKIPGLGTISPNDVKIEFKSDKLVITATESSGLVSGSTTIDKVAAGKLDLSTYMFTEKNKTDLLSALGESDDPEAEQVKASVWFTLKTITNLNLDDSDLEVEVTNNKKTLIIKASASSTLLQGEVKLTKGGGNSNSGTNGKIELGKLKLENDFIKNFLEEFDGGSLRNKLSAAKLLKTIKGLESISQNDFDEITEEKEAGNQDVYKKVTIKASASSKLISGTLVIEKKAK